MNDLHPNLKPYEDSIRAAQLAKPWRVAIVEDDGTTMHDRFFAEQHEAVSYAIDCKFALKPQYRYKVRVFKTVLVDF